MNHRLIPAWFLVPHHAGEFPSPGALPEAMKKSGVRALICDPALPFSTRKTFCGDLFAVCEKKKIPVLLPAPNYPGYEKCDQVLCDFPDLTLLALNGHSWGLARYTWPLLERFPNFHLSLGPCRVSGEVQETVKRYGAGRLCFGTGAPRYEPGAAVEFLSRLDLPETDRALIAGGNLSRLIGEGAP